MSAPVRELVEAVLRDGHLYGARPGTASRTLTVEGRRRLRVRVQADVVAALYDPQGTALHRYYPDLMFAIDEAVAELREPVR